MSEITRTAITIRLFGHYADAAGTRELTLQLGDDRPLTAAAVLDAVAAHTPAIAQILPATRLAVNCRFASPNDLVNPHDELALIGLVAGG